MNRKNLLITLALFAFTPSAMAADCVAEERNGELTASPTNPDSCYFSGKRSGKWEERWADGDVYTGNYVDGKPHGKWEILLADGEVIIGNYVDGKPQTHEQVTVREAAAKAANCVAEERNGKMTKSPTNPDSCYFFGIPSGKWETRFADGTVGTSNFVDGKVHGKAEYRYADGRVGTGNFVDNKKHGKWELRLVDGTVVVQNWINGIQQY